MRANSLQPEEITMDGDSITNFDSLLRKNLIVNGDFNIWQRGTSFVSATTSTYSADRFITHKNGSMVYDLARNADVPTISQSGHKSNFSYRLSVTTADASIAAGDFTLLRQKVEGYNIAQVMGKTLTLSFWVKATVTGTYCIAVSNSIADRSYVTEYTVLSSDTWEKKSVTIPMTETGGTWNYTNGIGLNLNWTIACGSTYQTTPDAWQTGTYLTTSSQVNGVGTISDIFAVSQIQLEVGDTPTDFEYRTFSTEMGLCQRYFEKSVKHNAILGSGTVGCNVMLHAVSTSTARMTGQGAAAFNVEKVTIPTITIYDRNGNVGQVNTYNASSNVETVSSLAGTSVLIPFHYIITSAFVNTIYHQCNWKADAEL